MILIVLLLWLLCAVVLGMGFGPAALKPVLVLASLFLLAGNELS